jgi:uncharacterized spore protein YtfJ
MKELFTDAISKKLSSTLEALGGAKAVFGDPITLNGEQIVPVAKVVIRLTAGAEGSGGGNAGLASSFANMAKGGGGGNAEAGVHIAIEPVGYLRSTPNGPVYCEIGNTK